MIGERDRARNPLRITGDSRATHAAQPEDLGEAAQDGTAGHLVQQAGGLRVRQELQIDLVGEHDAPGSLAEVPKGGDLRRREKGPRGIVRMAEQEDRGPGRTQGLESIQVESVARKTPGQTVDLRSQGLGNPQERLVDRLLDHHRSGVLSQPRPIE